MSEQRISSNVRAIMAASAVGLLCVFFILMFLQSNMYEKGPRKNSERTVPALGPKDARPQAQEFKLRSPQGELFSLGSLNGQVIHLNFWASWCQPCLTELPLIQSLQKELSGYTPILINMDYGDAGIAEAKKLLAQLAPEAKIHFGDTRALQQQYVVEALPYHLLIDKSGKTAAAFYSRLDENEEKFRELISNLLAED